MWALYNIVTTFGQQMNPFPSRPSPGIPTICQTIFWINYSTMKNGERSNSLTFTFLLLPRHR